MSKPRGKMFIDKSVQGALVTRIVVHWCVFFVLSIICLFAVEYFTGDPSLSLAGHVAAVWSHYAFFLMLMVAMVPSFIYDTLKLSNRFAGPVMRLKQSIRKLADGEDVSELKFRDNDFWSELSTDFNRMASRVSKPQA